MSVAGVGKNFIGAKGAVLENFSDFSENLFLKNEIKSKNLVYGVENFFRVFFSKKLLLKTAIKTKLGVYRGLPPAENFDKH